MRSPSLLAAAGAAALAGCVDYTFMQPPIFKAKEASVVKPAAKPQPADVLFIVDNSGSMADDQDNLARNFGAFINEIAGAGDYRIGIVTTDVSVGDSQGEMTGLQRFTFSTAAPNVLLDGLTDFSACGEVQPRIEHGCFRGPVITNDIPKEAQVEAFNRIVRVGSCGYGFEQGLNSMILALENMAPGRCNSGFLRPEANLVIVILSDEEDCDVQSGQCSPNPPDVGTYVTRLAALKPLEKVRVATIVGAVDRPGVGWQASRCRIGGGQGGAECGGTCAQQPPAGSHTPGCVQNAAVCNPATEYCDRPNNRCENLDLKFWPFCYWCSFYNSPDCCSAVPGERYVRFAKLMETTLSNMPGGGGIQATGCKSEPNKRVACLIDSICQAEFKDTLARIARDLVLSNAFTLDPPPTYPEGIVVKVNGVTLEYGKDFTVSGSQLTIQGEHTPKEGETVEIFYVIDG